MNAVVRAMTADNLRGTYVDDARHLLESMQSMFPHVHSPADITTEHANEYKRQRAEGNSKRGVDPISPWTLRGDLATLKAVFGKWLGAECGLLTSNAFANIRPPKCDDPEVRIVTPQEAAEFFVWFVQRWGDWALPLVYIEISALVGWRASEIASLREADILDDGFVQVIAKSSKTRKRKVVWLPEVLHAKLRSCVSDGWAFGRYPEELRQRLLTFRKQPHHASKVKNFAPKRLVGWLQDELQRYNELLAAAVKNDGSHRRWEPFTSHDFRRTAITGMQMAGVSEKEASILVGATPEVIRKHYEKLDQLVIAKRSIQRRLNNELDHPSAPSFARRCARGHFRALTTSRNRRKLFYTNTLPEWRNGRRAGLKIGCSLRLFFFA